MNGTEIDYQAVFESLPAAVTLLTPELVIVDVNRTLLALTGRRKEQLLGRYLFEAFPDADPEGRAEHNIRSSLERVLETHLPDSMVVQRYDVEMRDRPGVFEERYWSVLNAPVLGPDGKVMLLIHRSEEVTELVRAAAVTAEPPGEGDRDRRIEAELYARAAELQRVNDLLRKAHARESEVALALQRSMLPAPQQVGHCRSAVRYRPALGNLNVCGDWYDLVELPGDRVAVAVGDVVGHGLAAAGVMGQLRSALTAASRVSEGPAQALEVLGLYARLVEGAESTSAVTVFIDWKTHQLAYSSAGHLPPLLRHRDGSVEALDQATDPPLGARPEHVPRPQARCPFTEGETLVLYTDGLIERRREDIDAGIDRLSAALSRYDDGDPDKLADILLTEVLPPDGRSDDVALVIVVL